MLMEVRQLQLDPEVPQYFKPYSPRYPAVDIWDGLHSFPGKLFIATHGERHSMVPSVVRTLQVMPEHAAQPTPRLYWVVRTKQALSGFPASAKPFADELTAARLGENCPLMSPVKIRGPLRC